MAKFPEYLTSQVIYGIDFIHKEFDMFTGNTE
jgi:hypothetical protein